MKRAVWRLVPAVAVVLLAGVSDWWMAGHGLLAAGGAVVGCGVAMIVWQQARAERRLAREIQETSGKLVAIEQALVLTMAAKQPFFLLGENMDVVFGLSTIAPDLANFLVQWIFARRPRRVIECGSGLSSLIIGSCLRQIGSGQLLSLEHEAAYASVVRERLAARGLDPFVRVHAAPLVDVQSGRGPKRWYDAESVLREFGEFDLCLVDGPPGYDAAQPGRSGALYSLWGTAAVGAEFILDDGAREGEKACVAEWQEAFGARIGARYLEFTKGAWLIRKLGA